MSFIKKHRQGILLSTLLLIPAAFALLVHWSANEIASPPRRPLQSYHRDYLANPAHHGITLSSFNTGNTPAILCQPDPSGQLGARGQKIRADLSAGGTLLPPPGKIIGTIVLVHGRRGRKEDYLPIAERLCAAGFRCLIFDLPAHGDHPETIATYGIREAKLPALILQSAAEKFHFDPAPAGLFGLSMGGSVAIHSCAEPRPPWKALVIVSSFDSFSDLVKSKATSRVGHRLGSLWFEATDHLYQQKSGLSTTAIQPWKIASHLTLPTFLIHGDADTVIPIPSGQKLHAAFTSALIKKWTRIPGGTHENVLITDYPVYAEITNWFLDHAR